MWLGLYVVRSWPRLKARPRCPPGGWKQSHRTSHQTGWLWDHEEVREKRGHFIVFAKHRNTPLGKLWKQHTPSACVSDRCSSPVTALASLWHCYLPSSLNRNLAIPRDIVNWFIKSGEQHLRQVLAIVTSTSQVRKTGPRKLNVCSPLHSQHWEIWFIFLFLKRFLWKCS